LADGRHIYSEDVCGALNRIQFVPLPHWEHATASDRDYVQQELTAFYTSWLLSLPGPVLNPVTSLGLSGRWRTPIEWMKLAANSGFATDRSVPEPTDPPLPASKTIIVADQFVSSDEYGADSCRQLATLSQTPILGIDLKPLNDNKLRFVRANTMPDLRLGGPGILDSLKVSLEGRT